MAAHPTRVTLRWREGGRLEAETDSGAVTTVDGQGGASPSPMLLLLEAVGSCSAIDVVEILTKGRQPPAGLEVQVLGERRDEPPRRYTALRLLYTIRGDVERARAERAVSLSLEKYCSVFHSLDPDLRDATDVEIRIEDDGEP